MRRNSRPGRSAPAVEEKPMHDAARNGDVAELTRLIVMNPGSINDRDRHARTPLHLSAWAGQTDAVKLLCEKKADVRAAAGDDMGAIHFASQKGHIEAARLLLAAKADVNSSTRKGMTPLHFAVQGNHADLSMLLIKKGAKLSIKNKAGKTPLDLVKEERFRSRLTAAEAERRAPKDAKKKPQDKDGAQAEEGDNQDDAGQASVPENSADPEVVGLGENANPTIGLKREGSEMTKATEGADGHTEEATAVTGSTKKAKVALSHLDADEGAEEEC